MQSIRPQNRLCKACSQQLWSLFVFGFGQPARVPLACGKSVSTSHFSRRKRLQYRTFSTYRTLKNDSTQEPTAQSPTASDNKEQIEAIVREARQTFGDTLPKDFLSAEEYLVYERLYGPPIATTNPEDIDLLAENEDELLEDNDSAPNMLLREDEDGNLEEVIYEDEKVADGIEEENEDTSQLEMRNEIATSGDNENDFQAQVESKHQSKRRPLTGRSKDEEDLLAQVEAAQASRESSFDEQEVEEEMEEENEEEDERERDRQSLEKLGTTVYDRTPVLRGHPLTVAGQFSTSPSTLYLPKSTMVEPISDILADASNTHLTEVSEKVFGGKGLPNSTATFKRPNLKMQSIALEAGQGKMGEMEAHAFLAAIYPGAYASIMSVLVEVRKRLGTKWLRELIAKPGGPRIMDAGAGGAGIIAWREVVRAEYEAMQTPASSHKEPPYGKSTVVVGSSTLRHRASKLLDNTTFIPRLPDYDPSRDHPSLESNNPQPRKQYDIIIAPYTLWPLKEDYMRKSQVQNFWSLLDPRGGVLILLEKGVARGFELIAGARDTLLKHHIASPGSETIPEARIDEPVVSANRFGSRKETGMIVAPCTNHGKCPMYTMPGRSQGRKDFCHFSQRFVRPPYLQRILDARDRNHEDVQFSYVALRRGQDERQRLGFTQGEETTAAAFDGLESAYHAGPSTSRRARPSSFRSASRTKDRQSNADEEPITPNPLTFPRTLLSPIKRKGHIILDVCTPSATVERWTVPKSWGKQAYRDARKSNWGDLWALGAKTRVPRNLRLGPREKTAVTGRRKIVKREDENDYEDQEESEALFGVDGVNAKGVVNRGTDTALEGAVRGSRRTGDAKAEKRQRGRADRRDRRQSKRTPRVPEHRGQDRAGIDVLEAALGVGSTPGGKGGKGDGGTVKTTVKRRAVLVKDGDEGFPGEL